MGWHHIASHSRLSRLKTQMYFTNSQVMVVVRVFAHTDKPIGLLFVWQAQIDKITNYKSELFHRKKFIPCAETHKNILCEGNINSGTKTISENERRERERAKTARREREIEYFLRDCKMCRSFKLRALVLCTQFSTLQQSCMRWCELKVMSFGVSLWFFVYSHSIYNCHYHTVRSYSVDSILVFR